MAEVSSLLSLSLPNTNVGFLVDADKDTEAIAVEVRPRQRPFRSARKLHTFIELIPGSYPSSSDTILVGKTFSLHRLGLFQNPGSK